MVDVYWLSRGARTCARCRWDEWFVEDLVSGNLKRPGSWWPEINHQVVTRIPQQDFAIVCFPGGAHPPGDVRWLNQQLDHLHEVVLFITSDEEGQFPVTDIKHRRMTLWVQPPDPKAPYREGTNYIGFGSARAAQVMQKVPDKKIDWLFMGQDQNDRRHQMVQELRQRQDGKLLISDGFMQGIERSEYLAYLAMAKVVPCPPGNVSEDSFRLAEALDMGCVPIVDLVRPVTQIESGYWNMVMPDCPVPYVVQWKQMHGLIDLIVKDYPLWNIRCHEWWHHYRRGLASKFFEQLHHLPPVNTLTVLIPTSPIASHPDTEIIEQTVASVRERTDAEILIMCDGVRPEQYRYQQRYALYLQRLMRLCENWPNTTPFVFGEHLHQAAMTAMTMQHVGTDHVMFVEHDTPLIHDLDLDEVMRVMERDAVNLMRFYHEVAIHPEHEKLMIGTPEKGWLKTMQWSQRPHIARAGFYRWMLGKFFTLEARTMIEDVMHGIVQHYEYEWDDWRLGIWHPDGNVQRSTHLDGRAGDMKFDDKFKFRYPGGKPPPGAPWGPRAACESD